MLSLTARRSSGSGRAGLPSTGKSPLFMAFALAGFSLVVTFYAMNRRPHTRAELHAIAHEAKQPKHHRTDAGEPLLPAANSRDLGAGPSARSKSKAKELLTEVLDELEGKLEPEALRRVRQKLHKIVELSYPLSPPAS